MKVLAEYIWLDGRKIDKCGDLDLEDGVHDPFLRSKTKVLDLKKDRPIALRDLPSWGFDGSSTWQAKGNRSDCRLEPVAVYRDPILGYPNVLVMCEVYNLDGSIHPSNVRASLVGMYQKYKSEKPQFGIEQEYTLYKNGQPLAWTALGKEPGPQGPYYCGVGADSVFGRPLVESHTMACLEAGLAIFGTNAEVMPGQWEFQIGPLDPLEVSDQLWVARWLLQRLGEEEGIAVNFSPKPMGKDKDWNGAGAHTNFSTKSTRAKDGIKAIRYICEKLHDRHKEHIAVYGVGNEDRLTGQHETCSINEFRCGDSDRGASIRIPMWTLDRRCGYLEDRRPAANMDPYRVCLAIMETVFEYS